MTEEELMSLIERRRSGAKGTTPRKEYDRPQVVSGMFNGMTTGAPIMIITPNTNTFPSDYEKIAATPRPGHADLVSKIKYLGYADQRGGGHFSGRLTWGLVVAGAFARKIISPAQTEAYLVEAGGSEDIKAAVESAVNEKDSIGGIIECLTKGLPAGLGEPFFYSAESAISQLAFSVPAIKGIEFGAGFRAARMRGSEHNDPIVNAEGLTATNYAGVINGGITYGNELLFRVAVKPTSSISKPQSTVNLEDNSMTTLEIGGRHDSCIALRMPVIIESAAAIALADLKLVDRAVFGERKV